MYRIGVKRRFDAAHRLDNHPGKCSALHGHTWSVEAVFAGELDEDGMLLDFDQVGRILSEAIEPLDHSCLNDLEPFGSLPPTAENVAGFLCKQLADRLCATRTGVVLEGVTVWESTDNWASCSVERPPDA